MALSSGYHRPMESLGKAATGRMPEIPDPVVLQAQMIGGSPPWMRNVTPASSTPLTMSAVVMRRNRTNGLRFLYQVAAYTTPWFRSKSTGQVESTKFQPTSAYTWFAAFNDALYECGYPRNLGLSEKVPTIPPEALGTERTEMRPSPRITRNIFTNRSYGTAPGIPAKPTQGMHS